jgi:hypothetical protein
MDLMRRVMSRSMFVIIVLIILVALLLPYGLKSAEPDQEYYQFKSETVQIVSEG